MVGQYGICVDIQRSIKGTGDSEGRPVRKVVTIITPAYTLYSFCAPKKEGGSVDGKDDGSEDTNKNDTKGANKKR